MSKKLEDLLKKYEGSESKDVLQSNVLSLTKEGTLKKLYDLGSGTDYREILGEVDGKSIYLRPLNSYEMLLTEIIPRQILENEFSHVKDEDTIKKILSVISSIVRIVISSCEDGFTKIEKFEEINYKASIKYADLYELPFPRLNHLFKMQIELENKMNPSLSDMDDEQVRWWLENLKKRQTHPSSLSWGACTQILEGIIRMGLLEGK